MIDLHSVLMSDVMVIGGGLAGWRAALVANGVGNSPHIHALNCPVLAADALRDPVKVAVRVRTRFPKNSPAPQSYLKGDLPAYRQTLAKLGQASIENIVCGHFYDGIGDVIRGRDAVAKALAYCEDRVAFYGEKLRGYVSGAPCAADDESALVPLALKLIGEVGCGMPESLFLALHTVSEHIKEINHG